MKSEEQYKDDVLHGTVKTYYEGTENLESEATWEHGKLVGPVKSYPNRARQGLGIRRGLAINARAAVTRPLANVWAAAVAKKGKGRVQVGDMHMNTPLLQADVFSSHHNFAQDI